MALINCPECDGIVSDQALICPHCGIGVTARLQEMREEEDARIAEEEDAWREEEARIAAWREEKAEEEIGRRQRISRVIIGVIFGIPLALLVIILLFRPYNPLSQGHTSSTGNVLFELDNQRASITPGSNAFSASGKLKIVYSCQSNTKNATSIQLTLVNIDSSSTVWKKSVKCPIRRSDTNTIQVKAGTYDVGASVSGDVTWNAKITQE